MTDLATLRTDVVGSLLRPSAWKDARVRLESGAIDAASFAQLEESIVHESVRMQEAAGLDVISDGELSRLNFQDSFGLAVGGYQSATETVSLHEKRVEGARPNQRWEIPDLHGAGTPVSHRLPVKERIHLVRNVPLEEYQRIRPFAKKPVKVAIIGPDRIGQRFDHQNSRAVYPGLDEFMDDVVVIQRQMVQSLVAAGCRYIHIDEPGYTAYVDAPSLEAMRARGEDPRRNFARSIAANAAITEGFPGVTFGIHLCRGNHRSMWHREGSYDEIAERLFNELPHQRFLLEYDSPRAGGFEPLRFVPKGKTIVLGLVSTKVAQLESIDALKRRIDEAARFVPLDQLAISPQCGFSSDIVGNLITADDQKRKLERVVEVARQVWG